MWASTPLPRTSLPEETEGALVAAGLAVRVDSPADVLGRRRAGGNFADGANLSVGPLSDAALVALSHRKF